MRKFLKTLSFVMSAVVSLTAVPLISAENSSVNADTEADYYMDSYNIAWEKEYGYGTLTAFKDGRAICLNSKQYKLCLKTAEGVEPTAESLGLPEGMTVEKSTADYLGTITEDAADYCISADSEEEIIQLAGMSESWIESGIATEAFVHRIFGYCCAGNLTININLKEPDESFDPNSFEGLEDFTFEKKSDTRYEMGYYQCMDVLTAPEIFESVQADERVESVETGVICCCVAHYMFNDIPADEYYKNYGTDDVVYIPDSENPADTAVDISIAIPETQVRGDISGNGETDLYDAIEIAKYVIKMTDFDEDAMKKADFNGDGVVNLYDAIEIAKTLLI